MTLTPDKAYPLTEAKRVAVLSDIQIPFQDDTALDVVLRFLGQWKPDTVILNGDIVDCYDLSDFDRDPQNANRLRAEVSGAKTLMRRLGAIQSVTQYLWLGGNHEDRWRRVFWREAARKAGPSEILKVLLDGAGVDPNDHGASFAHAFKVADYGFTYRPYGAYALLAGGNLVVTHGFRVSQHSGFSAKLHIERIGKSCIVGHTHRLGSHLVSNLRGPHGAWENGCLCRLDPEYVQFPNWQQGFSLVTVEGESFHVDQVPILPGYRIQYGGKTYNGKAA